MLQDEGGVFPAPPWVGLIWPTQTEPNIGVNACKIAVTDVTGDTLTFTRVMPTIAIEAGLMVACLSVQTVTPEGEPVQLVFNFGASNPPYKVTVAAPDGGLTEHDADDVGGGVTSFTFTPPRGGQYSGRFEDASGLPSRDIPFFVSFSELESE